MSDKLLPSFEEIKSTIDSKRDLPHLTGTARIGALEKEYEQLIQFSSNIDDVIEGIESTTNNLSVILNTSAQTNTLLDLWTKILSQTGYVKDVMNEGDWQGAENEEEYQQQLKKFEELNKKYQDEKSRKEQEKEAQRVRKVTLEQKQREREDMLRRRVYGAGKRKTGTQRNASNSTSTNSRGIGKKK